jgi:hypothetical protein
MFASVVLLLLIAVGAGTVLLHAAGGIMAVAVVGGTMIGIYRPLLGLKIAVGGIVLVLVVGQFGPSAVVWLHQLFALRG